MNLPISQIATLVTIGMLMFLGYVLLKMFLNSDYAKGRRG